MVTQKCIDERKKERKKDVSAKEGLTFLDEGCTIKRISRLQHLNKNFIHSTIFHSTSILSFIVCAQTFSENKFAIGDHNLQCWRRCLLD